MSGGRASLKSRRKRGRQFTAQAGDISATHKLGHLLLKLFMVECKFYKDLALHNLMWGEKGFADVLWIKPLEEARRTKGIEPFVVAKQNRKDPLLLTTKKGVRRLSVAVDIEVNARIPFHPLWEQWEEMYILNFNTLMTDIDFDDLRDEFKHLEDKD